MEEKHKILMSLYYKTSENFLKVDTAYNKKVAVLTEINGNLGRLRSETHDTFKAAFVLLCPETDASRNSKKAIRLNFPHSLESTNNARLRKSIRSLRSSNLGAQHTTSDDEHISECKVEKKKQNIMKEKTVKNLEENSKKNDVLKVC